MHTVESLIDHLNGSDNHQNQSVGDSLENLCDNSDAPAYEEQIPDRAEEH